MSCRGDWYAQGDHARDAAKHATAADDEGYNPPRYSAAETLWYSCPVLCIPLSNDYQSFDRIRWNYTTFPLKHTSRHTLIRMAAEKCDSAKLEEWGFGQGARWRVTGHCLDVKKAAK